MTTKTKNFLFYFQEVVFIIKQLEPKDVLEAYIRFRQEGKKD